MAATSILRRNNGYLRASLAALLALAFGCPYASASFPVVIGSGNLATESRTVSDFHKIKVSGLVEVKMSCGDEVSVSVSGDDNIIPMVKTEVTSSGMLKVGMPRGVIMETSNPILVTVTAPDLSVAKVSGASELTISDCDLDELLLRLDGVSRLSIEGEIDHLDVDVDGASRLSAQNALAKTVELAVSGSSNVSVVASEWIQGQVTGAATVIHGGDAQSISIQSSGSSRVKRAHE